MTRKTLDRPNEDECLAGWQELMQPAHADLIRAAADIDAHDAAALTRLRRRWPQPLVRLAVELTEARRKAAVKFGDDRAAHMVCDVAGVEQATSALVAQHKAKHFASLQPERVIDLCCGIGGDTMALADVAPTTAVDHSVVRAWMAGVNARCETHTADATQFRLNHDAVHIDPSRRSEQSRLRRFRYENYEPGPAFLEQLVHSKNSTAIKLGPGVNIEALPIDDTNELEFISEHGTLVQAVLWSGNLAQHQGRRSATTLPTGTTFTAEPNQHIAVENFKRYVYTIDPAIERAGLLGALTQTTDLPALHPKVGLLTADELVHNPWLTAAFEIIEVMPWRLRRVRKWLHEKRAGIVEVKTRGRVVNPDDVQKRLRGSGDVNYTVFVLRFDRAVHAFITRRLTCPDRDAQDARR